MKNRSILLSGLASLLLLAVATPTFAKDKEVTLTGEAKCAKCILKQSDKCQTVIQTEKDGKTVTYYVADNAIAKKFHEDVCTDAKKVTATGTVKKVNGKQEIELTKIEPVK